MASGNSIWQVEISRTAEKQITKPDRAAQQSIIRFLRERLLMAENPRQLGKPLHGDKSGLWPIASSIIA